MDTVVVHPPRKRKDGAKRACCRTSRPSTPPTASCGPTCTTLNCCSSTPRPPPHQPQPRPRLQPRSQPRPQPRSPRKRPAPPAPRATRTTPAPRATRTTPAPRAARTTLAPRAVRIRGNVVHPPCNITKVPTFIFIRSSSPPGRVQEGKFLLLLEECRRMRSCSSWVCAGG